MPNTEARSVKIQEPVSYAFRDLSATQLEELNNAESNVQQIEILASIFNLLDHKENQSSAILLDLYFYTLSFAREAGFAPIKTSTLFSIIKRVHESSCADRFATLEQTFGQLTTLLIKHSVHRPPWSVAVFSLDDVKRITDYLTNTYFRHFKLYRYVFTRRQVLNVATRDLPLSLPPAELPPLADFEPWTPPPPAVADDQQSQQSLTVTFVEEAAGPTTESGVDAVSGVAAGISQPTASAAAPAAASAAEVVAPAGDAAAASKTVDVAARQHDASPKPAAAAEAAKKTHPAVAPLPAAPAAAAPIDSASTAASVSSLSTDSAAPISATPVDPMSKLAAQIELIAAQTAQSTVTALRDELDKQLKSHEDLLLQKVTKLVDSRKKP